MMREGRQRQDLGASVMGRLYSRSYLVAEFVPVGDLVIAYFARACGARSCFR